MEPELDNGANVAVFSIYDKGGILFQRFFSFFEDFFRQRGEKGKPELWVLEKEQLESFLSEIQVSFDLQSDDNLFDLHGFLFFGPSSSECNIFSRINEIKALHGKYSDVAAGKSIVLFVNPFQIDDADLAESFKKEWKEDLRLYILKFWS